MTFKKNLLLSTLLFILTTACSFKDSTKTPEQAPTAETTAPEAPTPETAEIAPTAETTAPEATAPTAETPTAEQAQIPDVAPAPTTANTEPIELATAQDHQQIPPQDTTELDLSNNQALTTLPEFVLELKELKTLNISHTGITTLPESICQLKNLTTLIGQSNAYKNQELPFSVFCLTNLKVLDMSHSNIRYIDEYIYKLSHLQELYMQNNLLAQTPYMLSKMPNLLTTNFTNNPFAEYPARRILDPYSYSPALSKDTVGVLHDCKPLAPGSNEREDCQQDMLSNFCHYSWWYPTPFERGTPFRRYKTMTDEEYIAFSNNHPSRNECYTYWLNWHYAPLRAEVTKACEHLEPHSFARHDCETEHDPYSEYTINGKSLRELRVIDQALKQPTYSNWMMFDEFNFNLFGYETTYSNPLILFAPGWCSQRRLLADTSHFGSSHEVFPEQHTDPLWTELPKLCKQDHYLYPHLEGTQNNE